MAQALAYLLDFFLHIDTHLGALITRYGNVTYALLFFVIFMETGLVVTPFLPGDSLLFAVGTFAAAKRLDLLTVYVLLLAAAIIGDSVNYFVGRRSGAWLVKRADHGLIRKEHLERTQAFYKKYGAKTVVIARFVPIVRTFAPFVAGIGRMEYGTFFLYNVIGATLWVTLFLFGGYAFGNAPLVQHNFSLVIGGIIVVSLLPALVEYVRGRKKSGLEENHH